MAASVPPSAARLRVFLADDHKIVRDGLRILLERAERFEVVGEAANGRELWEGMADVKVDVVITDMAMMELNGIEAVRRIRAAGFGGTVVMLSARQEREVLADALEAGVNAFVHKDNAFDQLLQAIDEARRWGKWLSPNLEVLQQGREVLTLPKLLSGREMEVLHLLAEGLGTKEVAGKLGISPKTVEIHRLHLFAKLQVNNVVDLTRIAIREGVVEL